MYKIVLISIIFLGAVSNTALANDNLRTCLSGGHKSRCNHLALTPEQRKQAAEAESSWNLRICWTGEYEKFCDHSLLSPNEKKHVIEAERQENLRTCMSGKFKKLCKHHQLSEVELQKVKDTERQENLNTCLNGSYATLCNRSMITKEELTRVNKAEKSAEEKARKANASPNPIESVHNYKLFIINGEKFKAKTHCLGWYEDDDVIFIEGSVFGACASAKLYNLNLKESCDVWCE
ncbi:MAG: hypothetical protein KUG73_10190 [Pseudomonadales bacterium]|nr:hypothetical protein [Pseudomonadales bacterium]